MVCPPATEKPHRNRTDTRMGDAYQAATPDEEARIARFLRRHPDVRQQSATHGVAA
jgi:hypothetical protein